MTRYFTWDEYGRWSHPDSVALFRDYASCLSAYLYPQGGPGTVVSSGADHTFDRADKVPSSDKTLPYSILPVSELSLEGLYAERDRLGRLIDDRQSFPADHYRLHAVNAELNRGEESQID